MARTFAPNVRARGTAAPGHVPEEATGRGRAAAPSARPSRRAPARSDRFPTGVDPMLAVLSQGLPADLDNWGFEYKWDGVRALCYWDGRNLRFESRNLLDITRLDARGAPGSC